MTSDEFADVTGSAGTGVTPSLLGPARGRRSPRLALAQLSRSARVVGVVGVLVVVAVLGATGTARAYWSGSGSGAGSATTGVAVAVTLTPGTPAASLYPGGQADVVLTVSNPNTSAVTIASLALDPTQGTGGFAVDAAHSACDTSSLSFTTQTNSGSGWLVPARSGAVDGALPVTLTDALAMTADASNSCQDARFTVYLVAGP